MKQPQALDTIAQSHVDGQRVGSEAYAWLLARAVCTGSGAGELRRLDGEAWLAGAQIELEPSAPRAWHASGPVPEPLSELLDLYAPLCALGRAPFTLGHLGQSIDGFIAGADGQSAQLNDHANIVHLHRLRALFDAVLVGRHTACVDNPRLTTRLVPGSNPVRVVVDLHLRCDPALGLFNDGLAPTILVAASDAPLRPFPTGVRVLRLGCERSRAGLHDVLELLRAEGLPRVFIEGGGHTVSRALEQGALSRLHVAVAPLLIGAGVPGLRLEGIARFAEALRPKCRTFGMGRDVLFDFELGVTEP